MKDHGDLCAGEDDGTQEHQSMSISDTKWMVDNIHQT